MRCLAVLLLMLFTISVIADTKYDKSVNNTSYYIAKLGILQIDSPGFTSPTIAGGSIGYKQEISRQKGNLFIEVEYLQSIISDDFLESDFSPDIGLQLNDRIFTRSQIDNFAGENIFFRSYGVYGGHQTTGHLYLKTRIGFVTYDMDLGSFPMNNSGFSYSIAVGHDGIKTEFEYTTIDKDLSIFSLGYKF